MSAIQPWRYTSTDSNPMRGSPGNATRKERGVDAKWKKFIVDNLLLYSNIFQQLVPRFFRMDLCTPENAYMLYRLMHVSQTSNLFIFMLASIKSPLRMLIL